MEPIMFAYGLGVVVLSVAASALTFRVLKKRLRKQIICDMTTVLEDTTNLSIETLNTYCPKCAYSRDGEVCDNPDLENICRFGQCTRFEQKRC